MVTTNASGPTERVLIDDSRPDLRDPRCGRPVRIYEWSGPASPETPLVVISHGTGGSGRDMGWLAEPLVAVGFRVVSLDHHGNSHVDGYHPDGFLFGWERLRDITFVPDRICDQSASPHVGVAGFSLGGYTAAAVAGARLDRATVEAILTGAVPLPPVEEFPDLADRLRESPVDADGHEVGPGVTHHDFVAPLTPGRTAVRQQVATDASRFFARHLSWTVGV